MREVFKTGGLSVLIIIGTIGPICVMKTIEAARKAAREKALPHPKFKFGLAGDYTVHIDNPADATRPENGLPSARASR